MPRRTHSTEDHDTGVTMFVTVDTDDTGKKLRIEEVRLVSKSPEGVQSEHLAMLEAIGLRAPASQRAEPRKVPAPRVPASPAGHGGGPAKRAAGQGSPTNAPPPAKVPRTYRPAPPDRELVRAYKECDRSTKALAERYDVPVHTVAGWLKRGRERDLDLPRLVNRSRS